MLAFFYRCIENRTLVLHFSAITIRLLGDNSIYYQHSLNSSRVTEAHSSEILESHLYMKLILWKTSSIEYYYQHIHITRTVIENHSLPILPFCLYKHNHSWINNTLLHRNHYFSGVIAVINSININIIIYLFCYLYSV